jgi:hypothetical protein
MVAAHMPCMGMHAGDCFCGEAQALLAMVMQHTFQIHQTIVQTVVGVCDRCLTERDYPRCFQDILVLLYMHVMCVQLTLYRGTRRDSVTVVYAVLVSRYSFLYLFRNITFEQRVTG